MSYCRIFYVRLCFLSTSLINILISFIYKTLRVGWFRLKKVNSIEVISRPQLTGLYLVVDVTLSGEISIYVIAFDKQQRSVSDVFFSRKNSLNNHLLITSARYP